ncbi:hypothetical protein [Spirosoma oryzicola]|uniref:hypothetical protein n=1 Tax=Spirosoma oryzicola TaxID=2898794 RepID=UPI001E436966|nr:hypothetical protein [Spirosoma oryzicola]UHG93288.1 hypothetical protein LQ777_10385 [Spirosoma oryzicola]
MAITEEQLLQLGFMPDRGKEGRYNYRGFHGYLSESGFYFHRLSLGIDKPGDLKYIQMLIDYQHESTETFYPGAAQDN